MTRSHTYEQTQVHMHILTTHADEGNVLVILIRQAIKIVDYVKKVLVAPVSLNALFNSFTVSIFFHVCVSFCHPDLVSTTVFVAFLLIQPDFATKQLRQTKIQLLNQQLPK